MSFIVAPCQSSQSSLNIGTEFVKFKPATVSVIFTLILSVWTFPSLGQKVPGNSSAVSINRIQWVLQPGGPRYKLQIAGDRQFNDVMFDGAVSGNVYVPRDLTPGRYHWRVTFAESRRRLFLKVGQLDITAEDIRSSSAESPATGSAAVPGWVAATDEVASASDDPSSYCLMAVD